jgi:TolA-binding protein
MPSAQARRDGSRFACGFLSPKAGSLCAILAAAVVASGAPAAQSSGPRYFSSRQLVLSVSEADGVPVEAVELWVLRDGAEGWAPAPAQILGTTTLRFIAPEDGWYGLYLVLRSAGGASGQPPGPGTQPQAIVVVDTTAPVFQIHPPALPLRAAGGQLLRLRVSLFDEHFSTQGLRVFYRAGQEEAWTDGGRPSFCDSEITWQVPAELSGRCRLRFVATDLAGNRAIEELEVLVGPPEQVGTSQPASVSAPESAVLSTSDAQPAKTQSPTPDVRAHRPPDARCERIRRLAAQLASQGRLLQAQGRLEDALRDCPDDPRLLSELGELSYRRGQLDQAQNRFQAALRADPDCFEALRGMALVFTKKNRYADARAYFKRLLSQQPQAAELWLQLGDLEHRLGEMDAAAAAWQQAVQAAGSDQILRESAQRRLRYLGVPDRPQHTAYENYR